MECWLLGSLQECCRKGGIVKRGAYAIGKRLKNIKKRQDEEEDRDRASTAGSYAPSRIGSYALESPALFPQDLSELGSDVTPLSLQSEGNGANEGDGVKKQFSFRRRVSVCLFVCLLCFICHVEVFQWEESRRGVGF